MPEIDKFRPDDSETWAELENAPTSTYFIQPGHYLCLGDNSQQSSDGATIKSAPVPDQRHARPGARSTQPSRCILLSMQT